MQRAIVLTAVIAWLPAADLAAEDRVEVSDDGRVVIALPDHAEPPGGGPAGAGSAEVPFGVAPDWFNDLRRQVGALQVADMNGDDLLDVVVGCYISNSFPPYEDWHNLIYYNTGGQLEASPSWISSDEVSTGDIQVAHLDGDAYPDIFSANGGFALSPSVVYFGGPAGPSPNPGWVSVDSSWNNYALPLDVDHDGDTDVITANQGNSPSDPYRPMYLFRNDGGVLQTVPSWQSAEWSIQNFLAAADLDGDGWEDLAVSKWSGFESGVYRNSGGTLQVTPMWTTGDTDTDKGVAWADVDSDGEPDLALGHDPTELFGNAGGSLSLAWSATGSYFGHSDLRFQDVDGDGDEDLAEVHFSNGQAHIYLNNAGTLSASADWTYDSSAVGTAMAFGDITGDGQVDLVVGYSGEPSVIVFYNTGVPCDCPADVTGDCEVNVDDLTEVIVGWGPCDQCPADLNQDGVVDVDDLTAVILGWGEC